MELTLREIPLFPPPWAYACAGKPDERRGRVAARRAFVELKLAFMRAVHDVPGEAGLILQQQVRQASEPIELWLIRSAVLAALPEADELHDGAESHCRAMQRSLTSIFPGLASG